ncbi:hypothetical protein EG328_003700 [Venturia inaequalis]|uniref:Uncharacterized protein n=1 Tax=Venturia inaequalis TaxID=5025 RepID=A0A8H3USX3_VENIN|nr:hypothetical protein EG328_003700 [Venturia inaequalis]
MNWFRSSPTATTAQTPQNAGAELKPKGDAAAAVKRSRPALLPPPAQITKSTESQLTRSNAQPCCVCKDEKSARDECMLFSRSDNPQQECQSMVEKYKLCMRGFGFETH